MSRQPTRNWSLLLRALFVAEKAGSSARINRRKRREQSERELDSCYLRFLLFDQPEAFAPFTVRYGDGCFEWGETKATGSQFEPQKVEQESRMAKF